MRTKLETIVQNLKDSFDGKPWYGIPVMEKLNAVPWQTVNDKVYGEKSIAVLVQHIINWRIFVLKKLEGDEVYNIRIDGENDWDEIRISNKEEWDTLKNTLQKTQDDLLHQLSKETDQVLEKQVPGKEYTFGPILTSIAQHDIYHLGQIAMLNSAKQS
ncbi:DinB family protein [Maribacter algarum]|uniref:DinB family protein n=1 Tax=Maribacter algarum (ex Zhang et al. 2020) TaxID=2578118 RepID=A0A5S3PTQ6_9FLAO|nr:DinB family protein [Maribacter algarum]TMM58365.1 DinB family protein [Maribacter algarum]